MRRIGWKTGFEIELLAPPGLTRCDLAVEIARRHGDARIRPVFVPQGEFSHVENAPVFENLTLAYEVIDADGGLIACCADDLTLQANLDSNAAPKPGWYRIAGDDARFMRLIQRHCDPGAPLAEILEPAARLFGGQLQHFDNGMVRLADGHDAPIAMAAPLPGERERPCEIITPPISEDHEARLIALLQPAIDLGFTVPIEAALHIHFDAGPLCHAPVIATLVHLLSRHGAALKRLAGTNPHCRRLGSWPDELSALVESADFDALDWEEALARLQQIGLNKYVDFNLSNITRESRHKHTFEVRILPVSLDAGEVIESTVLYEALLHFVIAAAATRAGIPDNLTELIDRLELDAGIKARWLTRAIQISGRSRP